MPETFLTLLLQRAIVGLESYVTAAIYLEAGSRGLLDEDLLSKLRNPFLFGGRGTADNYYNRMPAIIDEQYSLRVVDNTLWEQVRVFYSDIRNPLFHGYQIASITSFPVSVLRAYEFIGRLYKWIDSWHDFEKFMPGVKIPKDEEESC